MYSLTSSGELAALAGLEPCAILISSSSVDEIIGGTPKRRSDLLDFVAARLEAIVLGFAAFAVLLRPPSDSSRA